VPFWIINQSDLTKIVSDVAYSDQRSSFLPIWGHTSEKLIPFFKRMLSQHPKQAAESQLDPLKRDLPNLQPVDEQRLKARAEPHVLIFDIAFNEVIITHVDYRYRNWV
jgi:hypothetical protein